MSIAYTLISGTPTYQLFALNLNDLTNKIPPVTVAASHTLSDGTTTTISTLQYQRQRPGLLLASGNIYAGFGSFCDANASTFAWLAFGMAGQHAGSARGEQADRHAR